MVPELPMLIGRFLRRELRSLRLEWEAYPGERLVAAGLADVLWGVRGHIHLAAALAEGEAGEEVDRPAGGTGLPSALLRDQGIRREAMKESTVDWNSRRR